MITKFILSTLLEIVWVCYLQCYGRNLQQLLYQTLTDWRAEDVACVSGSRHYLLCSRPNWHGWKYHDYGNPQLQHERQDLPKTPEIRVWGRNHVMQWPDQEPHPLQFTRRNYYSDFVWKMKDLRGILSSWFFHRFLKLIYCDFCFL